MGTRRSSRTEDQAKCEEESERVTEGSEAALGRVIDPRLLEAERRLRARPTFKRDKYALGWLLDEAGIPWCKAIAENRRCTMSYETGEYQCEFAKGAPPAADCRHPWCPHAPVMRMRLRGRMLRAVAQRKCDGRW